MPQIHLDAAKISQLSISDFANFTSLNDKQKAEITVNGNTFHVSVLATKGNVSVKSEEVKGGNVFSRFFRHIYDIFGDGERESLRKQIQARLSSQVAQLRSDKSFPDATVGALDKLFPPGSQAAAGTDHSVAVYGFDGIRKANMTTIEQHNATYSTIDSYNAGLGIIWGTAGILDLSKNIHKLESGTIVIRQNSSTIPEDKLSSWARFLQRPDNIKKLNLFDRLKDCIALGDNPPANTDTLTGWKREFALKGTQEAMMAFIRKNVTGFLKNDVGITDDNIPLLANALTDIVRKMSTPGFSLDFDDVLESLKTANGGKECDDNLYLALDEIVKSAFFRQTSKLGLDFFKEQGTPVMFYWTNPQGFSMPDNNSALTDKWWHNPDAKIRDHHAAYITFSEMRHVTKMQKAPDAATFSLSKVMGNGIPV